MTEPAHSAGAQPQAAEPQAAEPPAAEPQAAEPPAVQALAARAAVAQAAVVEAVGDRVPLDSPLIGRVVVLGAHILDVLGRPVESIPPGQGSARLREIRATAAGTAAGAGVDLAKLGAQVT